MFSCLGGAFDFCIGRRRKENEQYRIVFAADVEKDGLIDVANHLLRLEFGGDRHEVCLQGSLLLLQILVDDNDGDHDDPVVIGHVRLNRQDDDATSFSGHKARRMLKAGIPRPVVEQAALSAGFSSLEEALITTDDSAGENCTSFSSSTSLSSVVTIDALVIRPDMRGKGLGKALAKAAVALSIDLWGDRQTTKLKISALAATPQLAAWYERMGAKRDTDAVVGKIAKQKQRAIMLSVPENLQGNSLKKNLLQLGVPDHVVVARPTSTTSYLERTTIS